MGKQDGERSTEERWNYIITEIAQGRLPYLDFAYYFGPLAVSLYGAAMSVTGPHLETLYLLGTLTAGVALALFWSPVCSTVVQKTYSPPGRCNRA